MPRYEYACSVCGHREDKVVPVGRRDDIHPCPVCSKVMVPRHGLPREVLDFKVGVLRRDAIASMQPHTDLDYHTPIFSNSAGIAPDQIPAALRTFPHHEYTPDGRMIFRSHRQRERALRDIGLYDLK